MANTYTQMYAQIVFAVTGRDNLIHEKHRDMIEKYICGIIINNKCKPLAIFCNPDHTHVFIGLHPTIAVSAITEAIKSNSSRFISEKKLTQSKFSWQDGYGAFTYSRSQINSVVRYILNQPAHHLKLTFREEYLHMLQRSAIEYDEKYLFKWIE